jgi:hypothetical protein
VDGRTIEEALESADRICARLWLRTEESPRRRAGVDSGAAVETEWGSEANCWKEAREGFGIITEEKVPRVDVWRGCSDLPGYIACIREKRSVVNKVARALSDYQTSGSPRRSLSILLMADPGAGKTSLARALAEKFEFSFVDCDLTQAFGVRAIVDLFDEVSTRQSEHGANVLVFVDEINAAVAGNQVFSMFLQPIEEGRYVREKRIVSLKPCVWLFAGTGLSRENMARYDKGEDFYARMDLREKLDISSLKEKAGVASFRRFSNEARLEQVYLGVSLIGQYFPDVREVRKEILRQFWTHAPDSCPAREIRREVALLRNVKYGRVEKENWTQEWKDGAEVEDPEDEKMLIRLVFSRS